MLALSLQEGSAILPPGVEMRSQKQETDDRSNSAGGSPGAEPGRHAPLSPTEEDAIQQALSRGQSPKEVAREVGVSLATVYRRRKQLGCGPSSRFTGARETKLPTGTQPIPRSLITWKQVALGIVVAMVTIVITWVLIELSYSDF